mmetsp:Transcript_10939/g.49351  ORF Transcript_10939/g.49351 Transcript_10939/m.49351 type:complete len:251 (-) Transcript_10939:321-1073(-)
MSLAVSATVSRMWSNRASAHASATSASLFFSDEQSTTYNPVRTLWPEHLRISVAVARNRSISARNWSNTVGSPLLPVGSFGGTTFCANSRACFAASSDNSDSCGWKIAFNDSGPARPLRIAVARRDRASATDGSSSRNVSMTGMSLATFVTPGRGMPIAASTAPSSADITASSKASSGGENSASAPDGPPGWSRTTNMGRLDQRSLSSNGSHSPHSSGYVCSVARSSTSARTLRATSSRSRFDCATAAAA